MSDAESVKGQDVEKHAGVAPVEAAPLKPAALTGPWGKLLKRLGDGGVEIEGMERIPENQRLPDKGWGQLLFWFSVSRRARLGQGGAAGGAAWDERCRQLTLVPSGVHDCR